MLNERVKTSKRLGRSGVGGVVPKPGLTRTPLRALDPESDRGGLPKSLPMWAIPFPSVGYSHLHRSSVFASFCSLVGFGLYDRLTRIQHLN